MSFELYEYKIEDLGKVITGKTPPSKISDAFSAQGIPFVTPKDMDGRRLIDKTERYLSSQGVEAVRNCLLPQNSIAVSCIGSDMGKTVLLPGESITNQQINAIVVDSERFDYKYVYYYLSTLQDDFKAIAGGSATPILNKGHFSQFKVSLPVKLLQNKIALILDSLDTKIEVNTEISHTLEQMAQALFKSWFVDFEPVKAKIAALEAGGSQEESTLAAMTAISGKEADALVVFEREHPEQYAELKATAELFPSVMQDSEMGAIPEGWALGTLSDIAIFANGKVDVSSLTPATYVSTENMLENRAGISSASSLPSVNSVPNFRRGHVLISNIRPYFKKIWLARFEGGRSADVLAFEARDSVTVEYIYNLLYQESFFDFMMLTSKGVKMPRGDKKAIMGWQCICPEKKISHAFSKAVGNYYSFIESNHAQNKTLTQLRDTLLPKLLSGEITLPEAEQAVSEAENV
ncbi:restriction endonuclease subunit S [Citrobacter telavivensis]|uniref:restriction endonuclease subunit S n=1 Tax=Citrobacter telavivensis TaxID=2653932 RepID=UPI00359DCF5C